MKIICIDNYGRETHNDQLICENVNEFYGKRIVEMLNDAEDERSPHFYKLVNDSHILYKFEP